MHAGLPEQQVLVHTNISQLHNYPPQSMFCVKFLGSHDVNHEE